MVSGRPARFLADALGRPTGVALLGLYGMEEVTPDGSVVGAPEAERWRPVVAAAVADARRSAPVGLGVEDKGLSVTLHWRVDPGAEVWARRFVDRVAGRTGPGGPTGPDGPRAPAPGGHRQGHRGGPSGPGPGRGGLLRGRPRGPGCLLALDRLAATGARVLRVAVADDETPPEVLAAADLVVAGPEGAATLLGQLLATPG